MLLAALGKSGVGLNFSPSSGDFLKMEGVCQIFESDFWTHALSWGQTGLKTGSLPKWEPGVDSADTAAFFSASFLY